MAVARGIVRFCLETVCGDWSPNEENVGLEAVGAGGCVWRVFETPVAGT